MRKKMLVLAVMAVAALLGAWAAMAALDQVPAHATLTLPPRVGELPLRASLSGTAALAEVTRMHGKEISARQAYIAEYGRDQDQAMIWMTVVSHPFVAWWQIAVMASKMKSSEVFAPPETRGVAGRRVYYTSGMGMGHYFWSDRNLVLWAAAAGPNRTGVLEALIRQPWW